MTNAKQTSCFMLDEVGVKKGISPGKVEEVVFTPQGTGILRFYCPMKSIEGYLVVKEGPSPDNATNPENAAKLRALIED